MPEEEKIFSEILLQFSRTLFIYIYIFKKLDIRAYKKLLKDRTMPSNYRNRQGAVYKIKFFVREAN